MALATRFRGSEALKLDVTPTGATAQRLAHTVVTDSSSSAITFAMATRRPLVFVSLQPDQDAVAPSLTPLGFKAASEAALLEAVAFSILDSSAWRATIQRRVPMELFNAYNASAYLAKHLPTFARRESHPDWLSIERRPWAASPEMSVNRQVARLSEWASHWGPGAERARMEIVQQLERSHGVLGDRV